MIPALREIPPTAGLPLRTADLFARPPHLLETAAAAFLGVEAVFSECSGTACLVLALTAMHRFGGQAGGRRRVIIPAYTCPLVPIAIRHCGLEVVLCDVDASGLALDESQLAARCNSDTLAIVATHLAGRVRDTSSIAALAKQCGAFLIEDAAQAFGARIGAHTIGIHADFCFFSLAVGKGLSTFEGGLWFARDLALRTAVLEARRLQLHRRPFFELRRCAELLGYAALYRPSALRIAYGAPMRRSLHAGDVAEAIGDVFDDDIPLHPPGRWRNRVGANAITRLAAFQSRLREQALARTEVLRGIDGIECYTDGSNEQGIWPVLLLRLRDEATRDAALARLWPLRLGASRMFAHALPDYPWLHLSGDMPRARDFAARTLTLSNSLWLTDAEFSRCVEVLRSL